MCERQRTLLIVVKERRGSCQKRQPSWECAQSEEEKIDCWNPPCRERSKALQVEEENSRPPPDPSQNEKGPRAAGSCQEMTQDGGVQTGVSAIRGRWTSTKTGDASRCGTRYRNLQQRLP